MSIAAVLRFELALSRAALGDTPPRQAEARLRRGADGWARLAVLPPARRALIPPPACNEIIRAVAERRGVTLGAGAPAWPRGNGPKMAAATAEAAWRLRGRGESWVTIGRLLGRDHSTAMAAARRHAWRGGLKLDGRRISAEQARRWRVG